MRIAALLRACSSARIGTLPAFPFLAAAVYAVALALPAVRAPGAGEFSGFDLLLEGWRGVRAGSLAWFANPLFQGAVLLAIGDFRRAAGIASGLACVLALTSLSATEVARGTGVALPALEYLAGFYVWLAAQFGLLAWAWAPAPPPPRAP